MKIKYLVLDVDGTLTDGKIYIGNHGESFKAFSIKDGYGIKDILPSVGIIPIIITGRTSKILEKRCKELEIVELHQGIKDKTEKLLEILSSYNATLEECAYIGDDLNDYPCMGLIKRAGGFVGCPADACHEVVKLSDFVSRNRGGNGAVRECIEFILNNGYVNEN